MAMKSHLITIETKKAFPAGHEKLQNSTPKVIKCRVCVFVLNILKKKKRKEKMSLTWQDFLFEIDY